MTFTGDGAEGSLGRLFKAEKIRLERRFLGASVTLRLLTVKENGTFEHRREIDLDSSSSCKNCLGYIQLKEAPILREDANIYTGNTLENPFSQKSSRTGKHNL